MDNPIVEATKVVEPSLWKKIWKGGSVQFLTVQIVMIIAFVKLIDLGVRFSVNDIPNTIISGTLISFWVTLSAIYASNRWTNDS